MIIITKAWNCPICGRKHSTLSTIDVVNINRNIVSVQCIQFECGTKYIPKRSIDKGKATTNGLNTKMYLEGTPMKIKERINTGVCIRCGSSAVFNETGMCWDCYKDERQA